MKVKAIKQFYDLVEDKLRKVGDTFEVSRERFFDLKRFVEEVKETKKSKKK